MTYKEKKEHIRQKAIEWQGSFAYCLWSYGEVVEFQNKFERLGRRFGLLKEFRENGII